MINCKVCGKPITNVQAAEVFEGMHWLCFHMIFEHDDYDPDVPCDDPGCPWNRISGKITHIIGKHSDVYIRSTDGQSGIYLFQKEVEDFRMPSIRFNLSVVDEYIRNYSDSIWIEVDMLKLFKEGLYIISQTGKGECRLESMSPEELDCTIRNIDSSGHFEIDYVISKHKLFRNRTKITKHENSFEIGIQEIDNLLKNIDALLSQFY